MELLDKLKILTGADDLQAPVLELLVEETKKEITSYCNLDMYDKQLDYIAIQIIRYKYSKLGAESLSSQSFSGVGESFVESYPKEIYNNLNKFRRIRTL